MNLGIAGVPSPAHANLPTIRATVTQLNLNDKPMSAIRLFPTDGQYSFVMNVHVVGFEVLHAASSPSILSLPSWHVVLLEGNEGALNLPEGF